jgi:hypothetical protein
MVVQWRKDRRLQCKRRGRGESGRGESLYKTAAKQRSKLTFQCQEKIITLNQRHAAKCHRCFFLVDSSKKLSRVLSATHFGVMRNTQNHLEGDLSGDIKAGNWWLGTCLGGLVGVLSVPGRLFELWHRWRGIWARCAHVLRPRAFLKRV